MDLIKLCKIHTVGISGRGKKKDRETIWRNNVCKCPKLDENHNIQEAQQAPNKMKSKKTYTKTHYNQTFKKQEGSKQQGKQTILLKYYQ